MPTEPVTTRSRGPGRPALISRDAIVAAALDLAHEEGASAVSMSNVARRLGVAIPALYYHLRNLDELLGLVATALLADMPVPGPRLRWDRWLVRFAETFRALLLAEPLLTRVPYLSVHQPFPPTTVDRAIRVLEAAGFRPEVAALVFGEFVRKVVDLVYAEHARAGELEHGVTPLGTQRERAAAVTRAQAPHLHGFLDAMDGMADVVPGVSEFLWDWNLRFELLGIQALVEAGHDVPRLP